MMDSLPVAVYATDAEGRLTYFNPAAVRLSGSVPELGTDRWCATWKVMRPNGAVLPPDVCPTTVVLKGGEAPVGLEAMVARPDGSRRRVILCPAACRDAEGRIIGAITVLFDVTDRKIGELKAVEQFRAILETTPECVAIISSDGRLLFMNSPGLRMLEASSAEAIIGKRVYELIVRDDRERFREFNERVCRGDRGSIEFDIIGLKGTRRMLEWRAAPLDYEGSAAQLAITRDVTRRRKAERAAVLLSAIVDSSDDAIISKDLDGVITSWNQGAERLFGYSAEEAVGRSVTLLIPPDRLDEEPNILARLRRGERVDHFETVRRRKDGTLVDISLTISPVKDSSGTIIGASKIARDISERKRMVDELRRVNQDLEQFAFSATHDLKEPLRSIRAYSELLGERYGGQLDDEAQTFLAFIQDAAVRMGDLIGDLLDYVRVRNMDPSTEASDAGEALAAALANLKGAIEESHAVVANDPLPTVGMDRTHLELVFQNLVGNAIKYRDPGRAPIIHIGSRRKGGQWVLWVSDNGIGIKSENLERIFGLFERLHPQSNYSGSGIGLAICQRIVRRHGGQIWAESELGHGSTFFFTVPGLTTSEG